MLKSEWKQNKLNVICCIPIKHQVTMTNLVAPLGVLHQSGKGLMCIADSLMIQSSVIQIQRDSVALCCGLCRLIAASHLPPRSTTGFLAASQQLDASAIRH